MTDLHKMTINTRRFVLNKEIAISHSERYFPKCTKITVRKRKNRKNSDNLQVTENNESSLGFY